MISVIRNRVRQMSAYKPPLEGRSASNSLLLDFNERTEPVPHFIREALSDYAKIGRISQYPEYGVLVELLADYLGVDSDQVMLTNGSDQGIDVIFRATTEPGDHAIVPVPTFAMLSHTAELQSLQISSPHFTNSHEYPTSEVLSLISERTRIITICNPSSPHGTLLSKSDILHVAETVPNTAILIDECYFEYCNETVISAVESHPNIFVTRSFSKTWGLASLRIGYIVSAKNNISELLKVRGPYDVNIPSCIALEAALKNPNYMKQYTEEIVEESRPYFESYLEHKGIPFIRSSANYILTFPDDSDALEKYLRKNRVLVRPRSGPGIENSLRFSLGTLSQMKQVTTLLDDFFDS